MSYMKRALELAEQGQYTCAPNPMVGCVIVRADRIVAEGFHCNAGGPHAEIFALQQAGELAQGATVYVTLEPCCHHGRTGPCVEQLINAQVAEVVIASVDPNPKVAGQGIHALQQAGIKVTLDKAYEVAAQELNTVFFHYIKTGLPYVTAKWAMSMDGKIATHTRDSQWISGEAARYYSHHVRQRMAAIIVGSGTVLADDPQLTVRLPKIMHQPLRVVVDSRGRCSSSAKIFSPELPGKTLWVTAEHTHDGLCQSFYAQGVDVLKLPTHKNKIVLTQLLNALADREISSVLVEGGAELQASFFEQDLVHAVHVYMAPKIIGGTQALSAITGEGIAKLSDAASWRFKKTVMLDNDILCIAERIYV